MEGPLVYWTVSAACKCKYIDKVYVATDSEEIRRTAEDFKKGGGSSAFVKLEVIGRSEESASDTASTESAMLEFAEQFEFDNIALIQATSPLLTSTDLDRGFEAFGEEGADSVLSVVRQKRFNWADDGSGFVKPINYDVFNRPRRQEFDGYLVENGAFYITSRELLLQSRNRISGNIKAVEMSEDTFFEIDEPSDWIIIESLMRKRENAISTGFAEVKMFLTDCDGCLTDGGMYYSEHGDELKKFNTRDGKGFELLRGQGILTGIITSESMELNQRRADKLKVDIFEAGCRDKAAAIKKICGQYKILLNQVAYIGDDINDLEAIKMVGYGCCPADAVPQIRKEARYIARAKGGHGVIREIESR